MKKRIVAMLLTVAMLMTNSGVVYASQTTNTGVQKKKIETSKVLSEETTVKEQKDILSDEKTTYASETTEFNYSVSNNEVIITKYIGSNAVVEIPEKIDGMIVSQIQDAAFADLGTITQVTFPDTITYIGIEAFRNCTALEKVKLPGMLTKLGRGAFKGCAKLTSVEIPKSLTNVAEQHDYTGPFAGTNLQEVTFEEGTTKIANRLFRDCASLKEIVIPDSVTEIGYESFYNCTGLSKVTLGNGLQIIGDLGFKNCISLPEIAFPDTVTRIGKEAFRDSALLGKVKLSGELQYLGTAAFRECKALTSIEIPKSLTNVAEQHDYTGPFAGTNLQEVTFEEGITKITDRLFRNCTTLKEIAIPDSVTEIGYESFYNCTGLSKVTLGNGLQTIGDLGFKNCISLSEITFPDTVTRIGNEAFRDSALLGKVKLSGELQYLGTAAFRECKALTSIEIPKNLTNVAEQHDYTGPFAGTNLQEVTFEEGITKITDRLFRNCTTLKEIAIPDSVTEIGYESFYNCTGLSKVTLGNGLQTIGDLGFKNCISLSEITFPDTVTRIGNEAFRDSALLGKVKLSGELQYLGTAAFRECKALTSIEIPKSLTNVAEQHDYTGPFAGTNLQEVTFEEGITKITDRLFRNCTTLKEIAIPDSVTEIGVESFYNCTSLSKVTLGNGLQTIGDRGFKNCSSLPEITFPDTVTRIGNEAFRDSALLGKVKLSGELQYLGTEAFRECKALTSIEIPKSLTNVAEQHDYTGPFAGTNLQEVTFEEGITKIANRLFRNCTTLKEIVIPDSVTEIGYEAFQDCVNLSKVTLGSGLQTIGEGSFRNCGSLTEMILPNTVTKIGDEAFYNNVLLEKVTLSSELQNMGSAAFRGCKNLTSIKIPKSLTSTADNYDYTGPFAGTNLQEVTFEEGTTKIANRLFRNCASLKEIVIPDSVTEIGYEAFYNCTNLSKVTLGNGLQTIGNSGFKNCSSLTEITLPDTVTRIGTEVFRDNTALEDVSLSGGLQNMGSAAFRGCKNLTSIKIPKSLIKTAEQYDYTGVFAETGLRRVKFEDGIKAIPSRLFKDCGTLTHVIVSDGVESIEAYAFENMPKLEEITIPNSVVKIDKNAFYRTENVSFTCSVKSYAMQYAMENGILINPSDWSEYNPDVIDKMQSYYTLNSDSQSGSVDMVVHYQLKEDCVQNLSNKEVTILLSSNLQLMERTVKKDKALLENYTYKDNKLTVPVENESGTITFSVNPIENKKISSAAVLDYTVDGEEKRDIIGLCNVNRDYLTLICNDVTGDSTVEFEGIAPTGNELVVSVDKEEKTRITATKSGYYSGKVELDNLEDGKSYLITVSTEIDGKKIEKSTYTKYDTSGPTVESFKLYYSDHARSHVYDLLNKESLNQTIVFYPNAGYTFKIKMNHPEKVDKLYVTSTRGGMTRQLEAVYDDSTGYFVTSGKFEEGNNNYVPGELSVEFELNYNDLKSDDKALGEAVAAEYAREHEITGDEISDVVATDNSLECMINVTDDLQMEYHYKEYTPEGLAQFLEEQGLIEKTYAKAARGISDNLPELLWELFTGMTANGVTNYYGYIGGDYYTIQYDEVKQTFKTWWIKSAVETATKEDVENLCLKTFGKEATPELQSQTNGVIFGFVWESGSAFVDFMGTMWEIDMQIHPGMSDTEKAQVEAARSLAVSMLLMRVVVATLPIIAVAAPGWCAVGLAVSHYMLSNLLESGGDFAKMNGVNKFIAISIYKALNWCIDPSGYVYEAVIQNRLQGVTTTAYCKENENAEKILWDAKEYQQVNPIVTAEDGVYAWDVPEGLWQVKYEKEGYETAYSDWLPVPPPQVDVNVGLVSKEKPQIESFSLYSDRAEIIFSKYMIPESVSALQLKDKNGQKISYTLEYDTTSVNAEGVNYAKEYTLHFTGNASLQPDTIGTIVTNETLKSYANIAMARKELSATVNKNIEIVAPDEVTVKMGETLDVPVSIANTSDKLKLSAVSVFKELASIKEVTSEKVRVHGEMLGTTEIILSIPGTNVQKRMKVTVGKKTEEIDVKPVIVLAQSVYTMTAGEKIDIVPEVYPDASKQGAWSVKGDTGVVAIQGNSFTAQKAGEITARYELTGNADVYAECRIIVQKRKETNLKDAVISVNNQTYTGKVLTPAVTVKLGTDTLKKDVDYTVTYSNNTNVGTATVTITGKGNYTGTVTKTFKINAKKIADTDVTLSSTSQTYSGKPLTPGVTVKSGTIGLKNGTDYTVAYSNNVNVGEAKVTVTGKGNYTGTVTKVFKIHPKNLSGASVGLSSTSYTYSGKAKTPSVTVKSGDVVLGNGTDYTFTYANNVNAGTATVTVTGKGNYTGTVNKPFTIKAKDMSGASVSLSTTNYTYTGKSKRPTVTVKSGTAVLNEKTDYTAAYASGRTKVGRYSVKVTFKGNYTGNKTVYFEIGPKNPSTVSATLYGYDDVKVSWSKVSGVSGYKVYYKKSTSSSYTYLGRTTSTSYKKSSLSDGAKYYFKVVAYKTINGNRCENAGKTDYIYTLKKVSTPRLSKSGTKVKVRWTNISGESGYQISKSTSKTGTSIVSTYNTSSGTYKYVSATKGKYYYYKVRAYKTVGGKKIYGPWSTAVRYKR